MSDTYTEVTSKSWFSRLAESIKSVLIGFLLFLVAFPVLFWNEGRAVQTARSLEEGAGLVVSIPAGTADKGNDGKLVHTTGDATTTETLRDPEFGVSAQAIRLLRTVEMYQWVQHEKTETRQKLGWSPRRSGRDRSVSSARSLSPSPGRRTRSARHLTAPNSRLRRDCDHCESVE